MSQERVEVVRAVFAAWNAGALIFTVRKGRIVYQEFVWDHAEALEILGLSEQDAHADS
jgi:hypothetical protein